MEVLLLFWAVFFSTPVHKVGVALYAFVDGGFADRIGSVTVIQAVCGAIEMANLLLFAEKDLELLGLLHLDSMQAHAPNFNPFFQRTFHDIHRLIQTALQHVVVEVSEAGGIECK